MNHAKDLSQISYSIITTITQTHTQTAEDLGGTGKKDNQKKSRGARRSSNVLKAIKYHYVGSVKSSRAIGKLSCATERGQR